MNYDYDAVVVGSGPNGFAAAITLRAQGLSVLMLEGKATIGGGMRSEQLTLPGFIHDVCSAVHPLAYISPFFKSLSLEKNGLNYIQPSICVAHPFEQVTDAALYPSIFDTANSLGTDAHTFKKLFGPIIQNWSELIPDILAPLHFTKHPLNMARFGLNALTSASHLVKKFNTQEGRGLWAGMAAHSMQPLSNIATSAIALVLIAVGISSGWPIPKGGSHSIANALASHFISIGGVIKTNYDVKSLDQLPKSNVVLFDVTPKQLLDIAGPQFSSFYKWQLKRYRYGMGVFKIDWALDAPIPFTSDLCRKAGTVHLGNTYEEIANSEQMTSNGKHPETPFVILAQPSLFDESRAPDGKHTAWAYCHVPNGSTKNMTDQIEKQIERFAPGFRERILARHVMNTSQMEDYNPNYIGGDINGGVIDITQLFTRPALRFSPYRTSSSGIYICSSSTPPGGGVHGMCGYHAAKRALKDKFHINLKR